MKSRRQLRNELRKNLRRHRILSVVLTIIVVAMALEMWRQQRAIVILTNAVYWLVTTHSEPTPADTRQPSGGPDDRTF